MARVAEQLLGGREEERDDERCGPGAGLEAGERAGDDAGVGGVVAARGPGQDQRRLAEEIAAVEQAGADLLTIRTAAGAANAQVVVSSLDLDEVLQNILLSAMTMVDAPAGTIALYDEVQALAYPQAHAFAAVLLGLSFTLLLAVTLLQRLLQNSALTVLMWLI